MLTYVVSRLDKLDTVLDDVRKLAIRHNHGAQPAHYIVVGESLRNPGGGSGKCGTRHWNWHGRRPMAFFRMQ
jgi:hypothetical protein